MKVAVVGGGIAGLAAAHRLIELAPECDVTLYEAESQLGGVVRTTRQDGYLLEHGPDNFITNLPWALDLCRRVGLEDELLQPNPLHRRAFVVRRGRLEPIPAGFTLLVPGKFWPMVTTPILSWRGKVRLACEPLVPAKRDGVDESLADFASRRLGREVYERLVEPLVSGIYTADPRKLSLAATLPQFFSMELEHGGLIRGLLRRATRERAAAAGARYGLFVAPRGGMSRLVDELAKSLGTARVQVHRSTRVIALARTAEGRWTIRTAGAAQEQEFSGVVLAAPAFSTADLLDPIDPALAAELRGIEYAGSCVVSLAFPREQIAHPLDGFGFVIPAIEKRAVLAASFSSVKYPGRAPPGHVLIRVFLGGAMRPEMLERENEELVRIALGELAALIGTSGNPTLTHVARWPRGMPQYHVGHLDRVRRIDQRASAHPGLALCGSALQGVGIPHVVHSGERAAEKILNGRRTAESRQPVE